MWLVIGLIPSLGSAQDGTQFVAQGNAEDIAYLKGLFDVPMPMSLLAWSAEQGEHVPLGYSDAEFRALVDARFTIVNEIADTGSVDIYLAPEGAFRIVTDFKKRHILLAEGLTPREFYRFVRTLLASYDQPGQAYVVTNDIGYAWLRADLPEEDAILQMLSHDDAVRAELGLPEYDHSQW